MNHEGMDQLLKHADALHSSPHVAQKVVHVVRDDDFDIVDVVKLLECDPALSVAILRLVNSSHYGHVENLWTEANIFLVLPA